MKRLAVVVRVEPGLPRLGLWCDRCLLPSLIEVPLFTLCTHGVTLLGTVRVCQRCQEQP